MKTQQYTRGILQYIPFFYVIWSDDLLSYSEISVVTKALAKDATLTKEDFAYLRACLDKKNPPANDTLKDWKNTIANANIKLVESDTYPLASFSQKMICHHFAECPFNPHLKDIEINLGIQPNHYNHLFEIDIIKASLTTRFFYSLSMQSPSNVSF